MYALLIFRNTVDSDGDSYVSISQLSYIDDDDDVTDDESLR